MAALLLLCSCDPSLAPVSDTGSATDEDRDDSGLTVGEPGVAPGALAFYEGDCPSGWTEWAPAAGRALVAAQAASGVGTTVGDALVDHVPTAHDHGFDGQVTVGSAGLAGVQGCCNDSPGADASYAVSGIVDARDPRLPTVALRVCRRDGSGALTPPDDPFPAGSAAFFDRPGCPDGWRQVEAARGRLVVGLTMFGDPLQTVGTPLDDGEDRRHRHAASGSVTVPTQSIAGSSGSSQYAAAGSYALASSGTTEATSGLPTVGALFCRSEVAAEVPSPEAVPAGAIVYVDAATCPDGWTEPFALRGRLVVGATANNRPGDTSGDPLEAGEDRVHGHALTGAITVPAESVALASGCCNDAIGGKGTFPVTGTAEPTSTGLPTIALRACQKQ